MIDLEKLAEKFDKLYATETVESFEAWLQKRKLNEAKCHALEFLGQGLMEDVTPPHSCNFKNSKTSTNLVCSNQETLNEQNTSYTAAA